MATGSQKVKTPSGWNTTRGAWVKTASGTWKDVDQIYIKTPTGWNNASGQETVQHPYPYIANAQEPNIRAKQNPYPYIANAQEPNIRDARQPSIYRHPSNAQSPFIRNQQEPNIRSAQEPNIRDAREPSTYDHRSPSTYRDPRTYQHPSTYDHRSPSTYDHRSPSTYANRQPGTYNHRSPSTYQNRQPLTYDHRSPFRSPSTYQNREPNTYNHRSPFTYRNPFTYNHRSPSTYNHRSPFTYQARQPNSARQPFTGQNPFTYNNRQPNAARQPFTGQNPFTYNNREPNAARQPTSSRSPVIVNTQFPFVGGGGGGGCFAPGTMIWLADGSHAPIEQCVIGQMIWSWNEDTKLLEPKPITKMNPQPISAIWDVELSDGRILQITDSHPIMLANGEWGAFDVEKCVRDHMWMEGTNSHELKVGDNLFSMKDAIMFDRADEIGLEIVSVEENSEMEVYNLTEISDNHTFFANGMLVHNFGNNNFPDQNQK